LDKKVKQVNDLRKQIQFWIDNGAFVKEFENNIKTQTSPLSIVNK
jgi:hypothetical protein